jgi:hypothetical protein
MEPTVRDAYDRYQARQARISEEKRSAPPPALGCGIQWGGNLPGLSLRGPDDAAPPRPAAFQPSSDDLNIEGVQYALAVVHVAAVGHHRGYARVSTPRGAPQGWYSYDDMHGGGSMVRMDQLKLPLAERRIGTLLFIRKDCE